MSSATDHKILAKLCILVRSALFGPAYCIDGSTRAVCRPLLRGSLPLLSALVFRPRIRFRAQPRPLAKHLRSHDKVVLVRSLLGTVFDVTTRSKVFQDAGLPLTPRWATTQLPVTGGTAKQALDEQSSRLGTCLSVSWKKGRSPR